MTAKQLEKELCGNITSLAEEQVLFLRTRYAMNPTEIIRMYGGQTLGGETFNDAVEHIAAFNLISAGKNGFIAS